MALDFSRNYSPPGVYIEEQDSTVVTTVGIPPTIVALVGPARGYQINTEQIAYSVTDDLVLSKEGIDATSVTVRVVSSGALVDAADYTLTKETGTTGQAYDTTFAGIADPDSVTDGTPVFVTYRYTEEGYYDPRSLGNFEDVKALYGEPLNTLPPVSGETYNPIASPLSLAAMIAIQNGATDLVLCATTPPGATDDTEAEISASLVAAIDAAYAKIESDPTINVVVPVPTGVATADAGAVLTALHTFINRGAVEGLLRFGVVGFDTGVATAPDTLIAGALPSSPNKRRVMTAYAASTGGLNLFSGASNAYFAVGNAYLAAAYAGRMQGLPIQQALTKQTIVGFSGLAGTPLANSLKNRYSANGVAVTEQDRSGRLTVRHGVTCDPTNVNTREASVVRARDGLVQSLSESTSNSGLIGSALDDDLLLSVKSNVQGVLEGAVSDDVIVAYSGLAVRQTSTDPSVVEVKFAYRPAYPLNYIVISFSIDMSTGATNLINDETTV